MFNYTPLCCSTPAYKLLARSAQNLASPDTLLDGAIAIAMHAMPNVKARQIDRQLQGYADTVRRHVHGTQPQALLAHLHDVLFDEAGFAGDPEQLCTPFDGLLPMTLETKRGLPITLSLIYKLVADRIGLRCWGVGLPGHFIVGVEADGPLLIDPFERGRMVTVDEARERLAAEFGEEVEWSDDYLKPASHRQWLTRMLQNLLNLYGSNSHFADVAAVLEMEMLLWPEQQRLQRDLGLVFARCGLTAPAHTWLQHYLTQNPDDPQKLELEQLLGVLK